MLSLRSVLISAARRRRYTTVPSNAYLSPADPRHSAIDSTPCDLSPQERHVLDSALRVDQAGELAANAIYKGQMAVLGHDPVIGPLIQACTCALHHHAAYANPRSMQEMWDQEKKHLNVMNMLQKQHRTRPTLLWDVASVAGFGLGAVTALMSKEAAMACTEAVETVIGEHYDE